MHLCLICVRRRHRHANTCPPADFGYDAVVKAITFDPRLGMSSVIKLSGFGRLTISALLVALIASRRLSAEVTLRPTTPGGISQPGAQVACTVTIPERAAMPSDRFAFVIRKNNLDVIKSGEIDISPGEATIEAALNEPAMLYVELRSPGSNRAVAVAGVAVAPTKLQPSTPRPADFDAFWESKLKALKQIPENAV